MNKVEAFSILEQALNVANQRGNIFLLSDAAVIQQALAVTRNELEIPLPEMVQPVDEGQYDKGSKDVGEPEPAPGEDYSQTGDVAKESSKEFGRKLDKVVGEVDPETECLELTDDPFPTQKG